MKKRSFLITLLCLTAILIFVAVEAQGQSIIQLESSVPDAMALRIPNTGFDFVTAVLEVALNAINLNNLILLMNPIMPEDCLILFSAEVNISQAHLGPLSISVGTNPVMGLGSHHNDLYLVFEIQKETGANNLLEVTVDGDIVCVWPEYSASAEIDMDSLQIGAALDFDYDLNNGIIITIDEMAINMTNFSFDISGFPDEVESWFYDIIEDIIEDLGVELGQELIQELIDDELSGIVLSGDTGFGENTMHYAIDPRLITNTTGATFFSDMELFLYGTDVNPCVDTGTPVGSRFTDNPLGTFGDTTPSGDPYHMAIALADDIFNQLLYSAYINGLLCWGPEGLSKDGFKGLDFANLLGGKDMPEELKDIIDLSWLFSIYPMSEPLIEVGDSGNDLSLIIDDMRFDWLVEKEGRYVELLNAAFNINIGLDIEMDASNNLLITFNQPQVIPEIHDSSFNALPVAQIESLLDTLFEFFFNLLGSMIPPIPIPGLAGWNLDILELGPMGQVDDYLGIYLSITPPKKIANTENPETRFVFSTGDRIIKKSNIDFDPYQSSAHGLNDGRLIEVQLEATGKDAIDKFYYSLDGSSLRLLKDNRLILRSLIEGEHQLIVKAVNRYNFEDPSPAVLNFICDKVPPEILAFNRNGNRMKVEAWDYTDHTLQYQFRIDSSAWSIETDTPYFDLTGLPAGNHRIEVRVSDRAGNISTPVIAEVALVVPALEHRINSVNMDADQSHSDSDFRSGSQQRNSGETESFGGCGIGTDSSATMSLLCLMAVLIAFCLLRGLRKVEIKIK